MRSGDKHVIARGIILWDGITRPEQKTNEQTKEAYTQYSLKIALINNQPEVAEIGAIATAALQASTTFKGVLPPGGCWPILPVAPTDFEGRLPNHVAFNAKSRRLPQVFAPPAAPGAQPNEIQPAHYQNMLYPGAIVDVIVSAFEFSNKSKGIALSLDGIMIIDASAPRLPIGGIDAGAAFAGAAGAMPAATPPAMPGMPPAGAPPAMPAMPPAGAPAMAPMAPAMPGYAPAAPGMPPLAGVTPNPGILQPQVPGMPAAPPMAPAAPVPPAVPQRVMTAKAAGGTYEAFVQAGWNDQQLIAEGYMVMQ